MKKINLLFMILFCISLLSLVSCIPLKRAPSDIYAGREGLQIEFTDKAPPESVYEQTPIPLVLMIKNNGAADILNGQLVVAVDKAYIDLISRPLTTFNLAGRSIYTPEGETQYINLIANAKELDPQSQIHAAEIRATACYPYKTHATATICVDTAMYNPQVRNKPCEVKQIKFSAGQGAPVGITKVDTNMIPGDGTIRPEFIIHIDNLGKGLIVDSTRIYDACTGFSLGDPYFNIIKVNAKLSDTVLSCEKEIKVQKQGKNFIRCTGIPLEPIRGTYPAPLQIELDYGYVHSTSEVINIMNK